MWRKPFKTRSNLIKGSECKRFKESLLKCFPNLSKDALNELIPNKSSNFYVHKVSGAYTLIYVLNDDPLFFDRNGKGDFYPTVYALWSLPPFLKTLEIHPNTLRFIINGADLMLPGVLGDLSDVVANEKRVVTLSGSNIPVAVGKTVFSGASIEKTGRVGKAMYIVHSFKDELWKIGSKKFPEINEENSDEVDEQTLNAEIDVNAEILPAEQETAEENVTEEKQVDEVDLMNEVIYNAFLKSIVFNLKDSDLPILVSTFWSNYLMQTSDTDINIKKSKYKKVATFLKEQEEDGIINLEEIKPGIFNIININRTHPKYIEYKKEHKDEISISDDKSDSALHIEEFWKFGKSLKFLCTEEENIPEKLTMSQATKILQDYIDRLELNKKSDDPKMIILNDLLAKHLFTNKKENDAVEKKDLFVAFKSKLVKMHGIEVDGEMVIKKGGIGHIDVQASKRAGNKFVTTISGLHNFNLDVKVVGKELSKYFAASVGYSKYLSGMKSGNKELYSIVIQGNITKQITKFFSEKFSIDPKFVKIQK